MQTHNVHIYFFWFVFTYPEIPKVARHRLGGVRGAQRDQPQPVCQVLVLCYYEYMCCVRVCGEGLLKRRRRRRRVGVCVCDVGTCRTEELISTFTRSMASVGTCGGGGGGGGEI
jgi:hypothetical protein